MKKHSLSTLGLSMSQAQSISNLCNQRAQEIKNQLFGVNNAEKSLVIGNKTYIETKGKPLPGNVVSLLQELGSLHATQAFLMENIRAKDALISGLKNKKYSSDIIGPILEIEIKATLLGKVEESWGWDQLSINEMNEYYEAEAMAAHIGQFIHKDGALDLLRKQLPSMKTLEWITVKDGEKTPLEVKIHHTSEQLLAIHEQLAAIHRAHEQAVNYYKAKVKNLVTEENATIARKNADEVSSVNAKNEVIRNNNKNLLKEYQDKVQLEAQKFEQEREKQIKEIAAWRIQVDERFKPLVDEFLKKIE
jgi:hypothetical protein